MGTITLPGSGKPKSLDPRFRGLIPSLSPIISTSVRLLLEEKHLYQNLAVDISPLRERFGQLGGPGTVGLQLSTQDIDFQFRLFGELLWQPGGKFLPYAWTPKIDVTTYAPFAVDTVKLYCLACLRIEAFNLQSASDVRGSASLDGAGFPVRDYSTGGPEQLFLFAFQCQSCKALPNVFYVWRKGLRISVHGRCPMEALETPKAIPKSVRKHYSDAVLAFNSGQTLPANFMLRVLIEQFASRYSSEPTSKAEQNLDEYAKSLPEDFKSRFPSLKDIYSRLSASIHKAEESADLFVTSRSEIERHFDARKLFELREPATVSSS